MNTSSCANLPYDNYRGKPTLPLVTTMKPSSRPVAMLIPKEVVTAGVDPAAVARAGPAVVATVVTTATTTVDAGCWRTSSTTPAKPSALHERVMVVAEPTNRDTKDASGDSTVVEQESTGSQQQQQLCHRVPSLVAVVTGGDGNFAAAALPVPAPTAEKKLHRVQPCAAHLEWAQDSKKREAAKLAKRLRMDAVKALMKSQKALDKAAAKAVKTNMKIKSAEPQTATAILPSAKTTTTTTNGAPPRRGRPPKSASLTATRPEPASQSAYATAGPPHPGAVLTAQAAMVAKHLQRQPSPPFTVPHPPPFRHLFLGPPPGVQRPDGRRRQPNPLGPWTTGPPTMRNTPLGHHPGPPPSAINPPPPHTHHPYLRAAAAPPPPQFRFPPPNPPPPHATTAARPPFILPGSSGRNSHPATAAMVRPNHTTNATTVHPPSRSPATEALTAVLKQNQQYQQQQYHQQQQQQQNASSSSWTAHHQAAASAAEHHLTWRLQAAAVNPAPPPPPENTSTTNNNNNKTALLVDYAKKLQGGDFESWLHNYALAFAHGSTLNRGGSEKSTTLAPSRDVIDLTEKKELPQGNVPDISLPLANPPDSIRKRRFSSFEGAVEPDKEEDVKAKRRCSLPATTVYNTIAEPPSTRLDSSSSGHGSFPAVYNNNSTGGNRVAAHASLLTTSPSAESSSSSSLLEPAHDRVSLPLAAPAGTPREPSGNEVLISTTAAAAAPTNNAPPPSTTHVPPTTRPVDTPMTYLVRQLLGQVQVVGDEPAIVLGPQLVNEASQKIRLVINKLVEIAVKKVEDESHARFAEHQSAFSEGKADGGTATSNAAASAVSGVCSNCELLQIKNEALKKFAQEQMEMVQDQKEYMEYLQEKLDENAAVITGQLSELELLKPVDNLDAEDDKATVRNLIRQLDGGIAMVQRQKKEIEALKESLEKLESDAKKSNELIQVLRAHLEAKEAEQTQPVNEQKRAAADDESRAQQKQFTGFTKLQKKIQVLEESLSEERLKGEKSMRAYMRASVHGLKVRYQNENE